MSIENEILYFEKIFFRENFFLDKTEKFESSFLVEKRSEFNIEMMFHVLEGTSEKIFSF